jgi:hypothetical protein
MSLVQVATALLKACAQAGLCLAEIGAVVSRPLVALGEEPSELEKVDTHKALGSGTVNCAFADAKASLRHICAEARPVQHAGW